MEGLVKVLFWWRLLMVLLMAGCSSPKLRPEASSVRVVLNTPDTSQCKYLGKVTGSPGNWGTEDYKSHSALMEGASNDLRNKAYGMGGNTVYLQNINDTSSWFLLGTSSISLTGLVYQCN